MSLTRSRLVSPHEPSCDHHAPAHSLSPSSLPPGDKYRVTTPVNWQKGEKVIIHPSVQGDEVKKLFPEHEVVKPYLREYCARPSTTLRSPRTLLRTGFAPYPGEA